MHDTFRGDRRVPSTRGGRGEKMFNLITVRTSGRGVIVNGPACEAAYRDWISLCRVGRDFGINMTGPCVLERFDKP